MCVCAPSRRLEGRQAQDGLVVRVLVRRRPPARRSACLCWRWCAAPPAATLVLAGRLALVRPALTAAFLLVLTHYCVAACTATLSGGALPGTCAARWRELIQASRTRLQRVRCAFSASLSSRPQLHKRQPVSAVAKSKYTRLLPKPSQQELPEKPAS